MRSNNDKGSWEFSWKRSMRLIELEGQLEAVKRAHAELQQRSDASETRLSSMLLEKEHEASCLQNTVDHLREEGREAQCQLVQLRAQMLGKEEEIVGERSYWRTTAHPCILVLLKSCISNTGTVQSMVQNMFSFI